MLALNKVPESLQDWKWFSFSLNTMKRSQEVVGPPNPREFSELLYAPSLHCCHPLICRSYHFWSNRAWFLSEFMLPNLNTASLAWKSYSIPLVYSLFHSSQDNFKPSWLKAPLLKLLSPSASLQHGLTTHFAEKMEALLASTIKCPKLYPSHTSSFWLSPPGVNFPLGFGSTLFPPSVTYYLLFLVYSVYVSINWFPLNFFLLW